MLTLRVKLEKERSEAFLYQMLPRQVATVLRGVKRDVIANKFNDVSILYSDIKGFTKFSASSTPDKVVALLSKLFSAFDLLTDKHRVYKVQTIGDAYVLVGGFPFVDLPEGAGHSPADHADRVIRMGFDMHAAIRAVKPFEISTPIEMRVGIHTGEIVAGIIGTKQLR